MRHLAVLINFCRGFGQLLKNHNKPSCKRNLSMGSEVQVTYVLLQIKSSIYEKYK